MNKLNLSATKVKLSGAQKRKLKKEKNNTENPTPKHDIEINKSKDVLEYVVVPFEYPEKRLSNWQFEQVKTEILRILDLSQIREGIKLKGGLKFACDEPTYQQLLVAVSNIRVLGWPLKILNIKELPVYTKILIILKGIPEDPQKVLEKLEVDNNKITTKNWHLIHREVKEDSQRIFFSIDQESVKVLETIDYKPLFNNERVKLHIMAKKKHEN